MVGTLPTHGAPTVAVSSQTENRPLIGEVTDNQQDTLDIKAQKIDAYFSDRKLPLSGEGEVFVKEAQKNNIPWTLVAAIAMQESTGFKNPCPNDPNNGFGWGSCKVTFDSVDQGIAVVSRNLAGNDPRTAYHYAGKDVDAILKKYNSVNPKYVKSVRAIMDKIENYPVNIEIEKES